MRVWVPCRPSFDLHARLSVGVCLSVYVNAYSILWLYIFCPSHPLTRRCIGLRQAAVPSPCLLPSAPAQLIACTFSFRDKQKVSISDQ